METNQFKTESKKLLDLMINSIYTNKEIFLRELISNASDAIDKYHYLSLTDEKLEKITDYEIFISVDKKKRTLKITDNGIGMTIDELRDSLGTIAKSGSKEFVEKINEVSKKDKKSVSKDDIDIIGQFGVGFYSAFMVATKVEVLTKSPYSDKAYLFTSEGLETYTIDEATKDKNGTEITLYLRKKNDDFDFDSLLEEWQLRSLVKKYSDYVRYPIKMLVTKSVPKKDNDKEYEEVQEIETLNSMTPLWKKRKTEVTDEEYNKFYQEKYYDFKDPLLHLLVNVEGKLNYTALLYIPSQPPYNLYSERFEKGLQLYSKGVFIMDKCKELLPDYLRFVKGLVDSSDLSLNISRELLQKSKDLTEIGSNVEKKIIKKLEDLRDNERDKYVDFFKNFGVNLKFGIYDEYGLKKDLLKDLVLYETVNQDKMVTLKEYVALMKDGQKDIYYASAKSKDQVLSMPQMDLVKSHGYDCLILPDNVDEFVMNILQEYDGHKLKSINQSDLNLLNKKEEESIKTLNEEKKDLLSSIKEALKDKVKDVVISKRLTESAVCLVSEDGISFEMEKVLSEMPNTNEQVKATRILELNPNHEVFKAIEKVYNNNKDDVAEYADLLYSQALLIEGFKLDNPVEFSNKMCDLIIKSSK